MMLQEPHRCRNGAGLAAAMMNDQEEAIEQYTAVRSTMFSVFVSCSLLPCLACLLLLVVSLA